MNIRIKRMGEGDFEDLFFLLNKMNEWFELPVINDEKKEEVRGAYFCDKPKFECFVAYSEGEAVGFVSFYETYATMFAGAGMYVEDIFVLEKYQKSGVGRALIQECLKLAKERDYVRVDLLSFGEGPREFYDKLGAEYKEHNYHYRFKV